jgi:hypothetical protein
MIDPTTPGPLQIGNAIRILAGEHIGRRAIVEEIRPTGVVARIVSSRPGTLSSTRVALSDGAYRRTSEYGMAGDGRVER